MKYLLFSPEMEKWARQLTGGAADDESKAKMIYEALIHRPSPTHQVVRDTLRPASSIFTDWSNSNVSFSCRDNALLYVALARPVGIKAFEVYVDETSDGSTEPHDCAFVVAHRPLATSIRNTKTPYFELRVRTLLLA
jgi:hypothetical protein